MKFSLLFSFIALCMAPVIAQDTLKSRILDIEFRDKMSFTQLTYFSDADWNKLTPGYQNHSEVDTSFEASPYYGHLYGSSYYQLQVSHGLNWKAFGKRKITPLLGISLGGRDIAVAGKGWTKNEQVFVDTLESSQTGNMYFVDSTSTYSYSKGYHATFMDVGVNLSFQTNREKRFSFITGIGVGFGVATKAESDVRYSESHVVSHPFEPNPQYKSEFTELARFKLKGNTQLYANIPIGMDFTLGNQNRTFWKKCVVGLNSSVGYRLNKVKGYHTSGKALLQVGVSVKYRVFG